MRAASHILRIETSHLRLIIGKRADNLRPESASRAQPLPRIGIAA